MANKLTEEGEIMQNFTEKAKDVLKRAEDAAGTLGNEYIGTDTEFYNLLKNYKNDYDQNRDNRDTDW